MNKTAAKRRQIMVVLAWLFWLANAAVIASIWWQGNGELLFSNDSGLVILALARLAGMAATFCALTQFVLMGRQSWLEPIFGLDRLAVFHRRNGIATLTLVLTHPTLIITSYSQQTGLNLIDQFWQLTTLPFVSLAGWAVITLLTTVGTSIYVTRKHLKFETWYFIHLANYLAVSLFAWHQFANGADVQEGWFRWYWLGLYTFAGLNILTWRWIWPVVQSMWHDFRVEKVVAETPTANSVYIKGRNLRNPWAKGGQFVLVRFLAKGLAWQEHPFSLSKLSNDGTLRLTVRALGDFTNKIPELKKGTRVIVSGPHGAFTHDKQITNKVLYIAGGIGITPIRSMIEERVLAGGPGDAVLVYCNRTLSDATLLGELKQLAAKISMPIYNILSEQPGYKGEKGFIDQEKIVRLVPDIKKRDIFLCGPSPMMKVTREALTQLGVPGKQIHYERFSLHKQ